MVAMVLRCCILRWLALINRIHYFQCLILSTKLALPSHTGYQWGLQYIDYRRIKGPPEESKGPPEAAEGPPEAAKGPPEASEGPSYNIRDLK